MVMIFVAWQSRLRLLSVRSDAFPVNGEVDIMLDPKLASDVFGLNTEKEGNGGIFTLNYEGGPVMYVKAGHRHT